jgi:hypothetical protein
MGASSALEVKLRSRERTGTPVRSHQSTSLGVVTRPVGRKRVLLNGEQPQSPKGGTEPIMRTQVNRVVVPRRRHAESPRTERGLTMSGTMMCPSTQCPGSKSTALGARCQLVVAGRKAEHNVKIVSYYSGRPPGGRRFFTRRKLPPGVSAPLLPEGLLDMIHPGYKPVKATVALHCGAKHGGATLCPLGIIDAQTCCIGTVT